MKSIEEKESTAERAFVTRWLQLSTLDHWYKMHREFEFDPTRKYRFDFAFVDQKVAIEIEGGVHLQRGGHTSGKGYEKDCTKYNRAIELGWLVLRYTPQMIDADPEKVIRQIELVVRNHESCHQH